MLCVDYISTKQVQRESKCSECKQLVNVGEAAYFWLVCKFAIFKKKMQSWGESGFSFYTVPTKAPAPSENCLITRVRKTCDPGARLRSICYLGERRLHTHRSAFENSKVVFPKSWSCALERSYGTCLIRH